MPPRKIPTSAIVPPKRAPTLLPSLVRMENMTVETWLGQIAAYRPQLSIEDRLETLLWSWPIRPAITPLSLNPFWTCKGDDEETLERKAAVATRLDSFERGWYPYESPSIDLPTMVHHADLRNTCRDICDQLRELPGVTVPDPDDDLLWLAMIFEASHGDGQRDYRRELQEKVMARLPERTQHRVCEIGERARDAAYLSVRKYRMLDMVRQLKKDIQPCIDWLRDAKDHEEFIEDNIAPIARTAAADLHDFALVFHEDLVAFYRAYQVVLAHRRRVTDYLHHAFNSVRTDEGRDTRATAGKPSRPWFHAAEAELKRLTIPAHALRDRTLRPQERRDLLIAWGLVPLERD